MAIQLKITTDYSIRALMYLSTRQGEQAVRSEEIAQAMHIPQNYLLSVIARLRKAGYVETIRGVLGGYRIIRPADQISLYDIIRLTEPEKINRCLESDHHCTRGGYGQCAVSRLYELAQEDWDRRLKKMTLKVLTTASGKDELRRIMEEEKGERT